MIIKKIEMVAALFLVGNVLCAIPEKPMVIIVPSYNNSQWYKKNLDSIFMQQYSNYRVIYVDDCSSDGTGQLVSDYIRTGGHEERVWMQCNTERIGALANIYHAVHRCSPEEIVLTVDGDDWLSDDCVLQRVNEAYSQRNIWMTYGQFKEHPSNNIGSCKQIPRGIAERNAYREYDWLSSHLRTFYAGLFQRIKLEDLVYKGRFFEVTWDMAFMFPMLEMAGGRDICITDVQYIYNQANVLNDFKQKLLDQIHCSHYIRSRPKYTPLDSLDYVLPVQSVHLIVCSDNPDQCAQLLHNVHLISPVHHIDILYDSTKNQADYNALMRTSSDTLNFFPYSGSTSFGDCLKRVVNLYQSTHCIITDDLITISEPIDTLVCIRALEQTGAYGFYFLLGEDVEQATTLQEKQKIPSLISITEQIAAWQFIDGEHNWRMAQGSVVLYRTADVKKQVARLQFATLDALDNAWNKEALDLHAMGLCFRKAKVAQE